MVIDDDNDKKSLIAIEIIKGNQMRNRKRRDNGYIENKRGTVGLISCRGYTVDSTTLLVITYPEFMKHGKLNHNNT
jgi:hypothetical protein